MLTRDRYDLGKGKIRSELGKFICFRVYSGKSLDIDIVIIGFYIMRKRNTWLRVVVGVVVVRGIFRPQNK